MANPNQTSSSDNLLRNAWRATPAYIFVSAIVTALKARQKPTTVPANVAVATR